VRRTFCRVGKVPGTSGKADLSTALATRLPFEWVWFERHDAGLHRHWKGANMLVTIAVILLIMWLLGMITTYTLGGFIHLLLILAIIMVLIRVIQGRNPI
jgi:Family of unknown function (DUF5670)